ncbi:MAG: cytochrome c biogenesis CcdA family protein [Patescibacteria group bacterium]
MAEAKVLLLPTNALAFDGSQVNFLIAFASGFITFFASCLLPLVPTYLGYLSGVALSSEESSSQRLKIVRISLLFVTGFVTAFVLLGMSLSRLSWMLRNHRDFIDKLSGLLFVTLGLFMLGVFKHRGFHQERKLDIQRFFVKNQNWHALVAGFSFGVGWSPCIGPVLAVILYWSAQQASVFKGIFLLISYGLGLGLPFVLIAVFFEKLIPLLKKYRRISQFTTYFSAGIVIAAGIMLFIGQFHNFSKAILAIFSLSGLSR